MLDRAMTVIRPVAFKASICHPIHGLVMLWTIKHLRPCITQCVLKNKLLRKAALKHC